MRMLCKEAGFTSKIVASTHDKSAGDQVKNLYGYQVNLFPPNGIDVGDNFFSRPDVSGAGRLYVGVFASATPSIITAQRNLLTPLLIFPTSLFFNEDQYIVKTQSDRRPDLIYESLKKNVMLDHVDPYGTSCGILLFQRTWARKFFDIFRYNSLCK